MRRLKAGEWICWECGEKNCNLVKFSLSTRTYRIAIRLCADCLQKALKLIKEARDD